VAAKLDTLLKEIRACRICEAHLDPRPVLRVSRSARVLIAGQAPGTRVHASGIPFTDPSGDRLREWLGVDSGVFYDESKIAILPMGFCFPGLDAKGGDKPPRPECARTWRDRVMAQMTNIKLTVLIGTYSQKWHLRDTVKGSLTDTVAAWKEFAPAIFPMPHPSWRNNSWIKRNPWFEGLLLPALRKAVGKALA
jgi:uracil-DNA glycosylase